MRGTNIVGDPLEKGIVNQLAARRQMLSETGYRDGDNLAFLANNNCWVELASFVEVRDLSIVSNGTDGEVTVKNSLDLAKNWVLSGGVKNPGKAMKFGVAEKTGVYGTGGIKELGYRPMPGIESVTIESQPPLGALLNATVKIKAWNLNQLSILDMLYFRLGYTCLLQWGHSTYVKYVGANTQPTFVKQRVLPIDIFKKGITKEYVADEIRKTRIESDYNYDALLGLISNYEWTQNVDGSYDCTVKITGLGSVIESLKINTQGAMPTITNPATTATPDSNQANSQPIDSSLVAFLTEIKNQAAKNADSATFEAKIKEMFASGLDLLNNPTEGFKHGYNTKYMSTKDTTGIATVSSGDLAKYTTLTLTNLDVPNTTTNIANSYIPLSLLLAYINNSCLMYEGASSSL